MAYTPAVPSPTCPKPLGGRTARFMAGTRNRVAPALAPAFFGLTFASLLPMADGESRTGRAA
jgi:hypothetical protein